METERCNDNRMFHTSKGTRFLKLQEKALQSLIKRG